MTKKHGTSSALLLRDQSYLAAIPGGLSTQSLSLDLALGRPGIPRGRLTEIFGLESHGKSTLAAHLLAEAQRRGGVGILFDNESAYELEHAEAMGIDLDKLIVIQAPSMEDVFEMMITTCDAIPDDVGPVVVVWDSVAGTPAQAEIDGKFDDRFVGIHARILGQGLRKIIPYIAEKKIALVFVNQLRDNIQKFGYGEQYKTFGGHAVRFHSTVRLYIKRIKKERSGTRPVGIQTKVKVHKSKIGAPDREADVFIGYGGGIDRIRDLIGCAVDFGILQTGKGTISYEGESCRTNMFETKLLPELGGASGLRRMILKEAVRDKLIKPYSK